MHFEDFLLKLVKTEENEYENFNSFMNAIPFVFPAIFLPESI